MLNIVLEMILNLSVVGLLFGALVYAASKEHGVSFREELFAEDEDV